MAVPVADPRRAASWQKVLESHGFINGDLICPPPNKRLHLFFGQLDTAPKCDRPFRFDDEVIEAHDIHYSGDVTFLLWQDLTSISIR